MMNQDVTLPLARLACPAGTEPDAAHVEAFKRAMGLMAGAVTVITAGHNGAARGLTATAVCSVSIAPPTLLICVNKFGEAHDAIAGSGHFCVNILSEADRPVADRFAGREGLAGAEKFSGARWISLASGSPALEDALVNIDCKVAEMVEAFTHTVFFGTVLDVRLGETRPPLVHFDRAYRSIA
ncbi:FMN reductase (NADH) RutF [Hartmannibacter diazotrophicus]|uniref:FMN reductase (NADH) RutF n=1 Tax=Hartmannibacter diazotrophicus TaxID=1482074 RepID=A0A2C9D0K5_9HYPH|nr:flavin reductase family protein [Hartmannibacter diazotrophicus]SON53776.1 FMN reductase (NADH) RutF [Hartmannibacter diazotrophicus]